MKRGTEPKWQPTLLVQSVPGALHTRIEPYRLLDRLTAYDTGLHLVAHGKSQIYSVEGGNAHMRYYLARLAKKSHGFSRCIQALKRNIALFVQPWNRRQLFKRAYPSYNPPLRDFACGFRYPRIHTSAQSL